jgi:hypothetical protein
MFTADSGSSHERFSNGINDSGFDLDAAKLPNEANFHLAPRESKSFLISFPVVQGKDFAISLKAESNLWLSWQLV